MRDSFDALQNRDFRKFFFAALASNSGSWLQGLASPWVMFEITQSGSWVGISVFSLLLPMALMGPIAGPLADRISRRTILLRAQPLLAVAAMGFAVLWWTGVTEPLAYVGLSLVYGVINGFAMPAWQAYVSDLVPRELLPNAITLNSAQFNAARAIGPSIGGVVLATLGPGWCFALNAFSFLFVVVALFQLPPTLPSGNSTEPPLRQFRLGYAYARTQPGIITSYFAAALVAVCGGTLVQVHLVLFAEQVFSVSERWFGVMVSAFGLGAIVMTPWLTTFAPKYRRSQVIIGGLIAYGVGELILSSTKVLAVGLVGVFIAGGSHITMATTTNSTLQLQTAEAMRGRIMSMYLIVLTLGMPIGAIIEGPLAERFGPRPVVTAMGSLMIAGALWIWFSGRAATFDTEFADTNDEDPPQEPDPIDPVGGNRAKAWDGFVDALPPPPMPWPPGGRLVVVAPHPDDEVLPTGATLAAASDAGVDITVIAVTDGDASHPHYDASQVAELIVRRANESAEAYEAAGIVARRIRLGLPDGDVARHRAELLVELTTHLADADLVICPLPDDGHPDHDVVGELATRVARDNDITVVHMPIWSWNWRQVDDHDLPAAGWAYSFSDDLLARKTAALACYESQVTELQADGRPGLPPSFLEHFTRNNEVFFHG